jgi:hypothetical protein
MAVLYSISGSHELLVTYHNGHCGRLEPLFGRLRKFQLHILFLSNVFLSDQYCIL